MIPDGQSKRKPGNVCAQLLLSAVVLLVPPILMVAGVMYLGSASEGAGQKIGADRADKRPELATSPALMSAEERPVIVEPRSVAQAPASSTQTQITKDSTRYIGPVTVGDGSEQLTTVEVEPPQSAAVADLSSKLPDNCRLKGAGHRPAQQPSTFRTPSLWSKRRNRPPAQAPTRAETGWFSCRHRGPRRRPSRRSARPNSQEGSGATRRVLCGTSRPAGSRRG
jgi:hypothetical protein